MLRADDPSEGACYTNTATRKWVCMNMLLHCHRILSQASNVQNLDKLDKLRSFDSTDRDTFKELNYLLWSLDPPIMDAIRICVCFENFFKSELLLKGYVIHKIIKSELSSGFKYLAKDQSTRPIKISDIKKADGLRWTRGNNYNFQSLDRFTLEFKIFLKKPMYRAKIKVPKEIFEFLEKINQKRNTLHYLVTDVSFYNNTVLDEYKTIREWFNNSLIPKHDKLRKELNFPESHRLKPI